MLAVPPVKGQKQVLGDAGRESSSGSSVLVLRHLQAVAVPQDVSCPRMPPGTWDSSLAQGQSSAGLPRLGLNIEQTVIHPSQVGRDPSLRLGQMNFTLKVTEKLFWAAENLLLVSGLARELLQLSRSS